VRAAFTLYREPLVEAARLAGVNGVMLAAVVWQESRGGVHFKTRQHDPRMWYRYEPGFWRRYLARKKAYQPAAHVAADPAAFELHKRRVSASYGLCQIMYATARDFHYRGEPEGLLDPMVNLRLGARILARYKRGHTWRAALLRYNGGGRPAYADEVFEKGRRLLAGGLRFS
jgi:soluble lytic murein transglycosylase-like protein